NEDDLIPVPKSGAYVVADGDENSGRKYGEALGIPQDTTDKMIQTIQGKSFGVRFETPDRNHWNVTFYQGGKPHTILAEKDKEVAGLSVLGIPVKNHLTVEAKRLILKQTYDNGKVAEIIWTFKKDHLTITVLTGESNKSVLLFNKDDNFGL
ncbi:unnamed protein product, partial [Orchesella dallaii]